MSKELIERLRSEWRKPENKPPEMCEAADHIEQLEAEVERLSSMCCCNPEFKLSMYAGGASAEGLYGTLTMQMHGVFVKYVREEQLAASQAREQQLLKRIASTTVLLEAVCAVNPDSACAKYELGENRKMVNYPSATTALEAMIAKAGEVMRERAAKGAEKEAVQIVVDGREERAYNNAVADCANAIRALPGVTLEDIIK